MGHDKGGGRLYKRGRTYCLDFWEGSVRRRCSLKTRDRRAAEIKRAEILKNSALRGAGVETYTDAAEADPKALAAEYIAELKRRGRDPRHYGLVEHRLERMIKGATSLKSITSELVRNRLAAIAENDGVSPATINKYRLSLNAFFSWLVKEGRWGQNPTKAVARVREVGPTRERRSLRLEDVQLLLGKAPAHRSLVYRVAVTTGIRRSELNALLRDDVDLGGAVIRLRPEVTKNGRETFQAIPLGTVEALRQWFAENPDEERALPPVPIMRTFYKDLAAAKIEKETAGGVVDFHSLRTTFITSLARNGVSLAQAQKLARHSTPLLTANHYTKLELVDAHAAVAKVDLGPCVEAMEAEAGTAPAEPTDASAEVCQNLCQTGVTPTDSIALTCTTRRSDPQNRPPPQLVAGASVRAGSGDWIRTSDPRLMNPLL